MTDTLNDAQINQPAGQSPLGGASTDPTVPVPPPIPQPPMPSPDADNFVVPPPEEVKPPEPPNLPAAGDKPKKKRISPKVAIIGLFFFLIMIPLAGLALKNTTNILNFAASKPGDQKNIIKLNSSRVQNQTANNQANGGGNGGGSTADVAVGRFGWCYSCNGGKGAPATVTDWSNPNADIAGTYKSDSNGQRFIIDIADTKNAAVEYNIAHPGLIGNNIGDPAANLQPGTTNQLKPLILPVAPVGITSKASCLASGSDAEWGSEPGAECGSGGYRNECKSGGHWYFVNCDNTNRPPRENPGTSPLTPTSPPPPPPPAQCTNIIAFKDGQALTSDQLAALHLGDTISLGYAPGGSATKVRFRVNSGTWNETTTKATNGYFFWNYTLADDTSFSVEAQWFDGSWH